MFAQSSIKLQGCVYEPSEPRFPIRTFPSISPSAETLTRSQHVPFARIVHNDISPRESFRSNPAFVHKRHDPLVMCLSPLVFRDGGVANCRLNCRTWSPPRTARPIGNTNWEISIYKTEVSHHSSFKISDTDAWRLKVPVSDPKSGISSPDSPDDVKDGISVPINRSSV